MERTKRRPISRTQNRVGMIGPKAASRITDEFEVRVEQQFRERLMTLPEGTRVTEGWQDICTWITATTSIPYGSDDDDGDGAVHAHLTVLCMVVIEKLCEAGFLTAKWPEAPEDEYVRTGKRA